MIRTLWDAKCVPAYLSHNDRPIFVLLLHADAEHATFYKALKGKRLIVFSGLFKDGSTLFSAGELDKYMEVDTTEYIYALLYNWGKGSYVEKEKRELTVEERKQLNKQLINEMDIEE